MTICKNCGVALEDDMKQCPLCGTNAGEDSGTPAPPGISAYMKIDVAVEPKEKHLLQRILWQVTSILLLSGIISTLVIDLAVHARITWSVYPVTVCMIIFSYVSLFAFWHTKKIYQVIVGLLIASLLFLALDVLLPGATWPLQLGLPLLCAVNLAAVILIWSVKLTTHRGLNVIAYACVAIAVLCMGIEGILSLYIKNAFVLGWSVVVAACMLPVTAALLFMHYRIKKNPDMKKVFHT